MNNITRCKGQRIKDKFKGGVDKLYALCDYINKKAMSWYALNIEFSPDDVELIKRVQKTMEELTSISAEFKKNEIQYDYLDLGYQVYLYTCDECNGKLYVIRFKRNELGHECNVYKCNDCRKEYEDYHPNTYKQTKEYFDIISNSTNITLLSDSVSEEDKVSIRNDFKELQLMEERLSKDDEDVSKYHKSLKEHVLSTIKECGETYKDYFKYKHHFDRKTQA